MTDIAGIVAHNMFRQDANRQVLIGLLVAMARRSDDPDSLLREVAEVASSITEVDPSHPVARGSAVVQDQIDLLVVAAKQRL